MTAADTPIDWPGILAPGASAGLLRAGCTPEDIAAETFGLIYLATPYSKLAVDAAGNWCAHGSVKAWEAASRAAAALCKRGVSAYSPIAMAADICSCDVTIDPLDQNFWTGWCQPLLSAADFVVVPDIPGWSASVGVWREVTWALSHGKPVILYAEGAE